MTNDVFTYDNQPTDSVDCWKLGAALRKAYEEPRFGDPIDRGLILLRELQREGFGAVRLEAHAVSPWRPMRTAPKDGTAVLVLVEGSDVPRAVRWLAGPDAQHATAETIGPGWYMTWDGTRVQAYDGPRYWMPCPDDPDAQ